MNWFQIGKGVYQGYIFLSDFNFYAEYIVQNARLDEAQSRIKIARRHRPYGRKQRGVKEPLDEGERGE